MKLLLFFILSSSVTFGVENTKIEKPATEKTTPVPAEDGPQMQEAAPGKENDFEIGPYDREGKWRPKKKVEEATPTT